MLIYCKDMYGLELYAKKNAAFGLSGGVVVINGGCDHAFL